MAHIPGYNYCGPFTSDFSKKPVNFLDSACRRHDLSYKKVSDYILYNQGDEDLLREIKKTPGLAAKFVRGVFKAKEYLMGYNRPYSTTSSDRKKKGALAKLQAAIRASLHKNQSVARRSVANPFVKYRYYGLGAVSSNYPKWSTRGKRSRGAVGRGRYRKSIVRFRAKRRRRM